MEVCTVESLRARHARSALRPRWPPPGFTDNQGLQPGFYSVLARSANDAPCAWYRPRKPDVRLRRMKKILLWFLLAVTLLVVAGLGYVWFGPVAVGDKKVMLDFLLGRSIEPPTAEQVASQLRRA